MGLLDRKSIKLDNVQDFEWSPAEPILCAFQTEQSNGNLPARISLIRIPDRVELRQKNLFSVSGRRSVSVASAVCNSTVQQSAEHTRLVETVASQVMHLS